MGTIRNRSGGMSKSLEISSRAYIMDAGKIVETGTHNELLKQGGYYTKLYEAQFMAEEVA